MKKKFSEELVNQLEFINLSSGSKGLVLGHDDAPLAKEVIKHYNEMVDMLNRIFSFLHLLYLRDSNRISGVNSDGSTELFYRLNVLMDSLPDEKPKSKYSEEEKLKIIKRWYNHRLPVIACEGLSDDIYTTLEFVMNYLDSQTNYTGGEYESYRTR